MRARYIGMCLGLWACLTGVVVGQAQVDQAAESRASKPIVALAWSESPQRSFDYIVPFMFVRTTTHPEQAKAFTDRQPEGYRALLWVLMGGDPLAHPEDQIKTAEGKPTRGIWFEHGEAQSTQATREFFTKFKEIGGQLDYLIVDYENGLGVWHLPKESFAAIEADPRFAEERWAEKLGFSDLEKHLVQERYKSDRLYVWNRLMAERTVGMLNRCIYDPVAGLFPEVQCSNYSHRYSTGDVPDRNGHMEERPSTGLFHVGTHQSQDTYGRVQQVRLKKLNGAEAFGISPYKSCLLAVNCVRGMLNSSEVPIMPWIGYRGFDREDAAMGKTDYYQETVIHTAMSSPDVILYWNPRPWAGQDAKLWCDDEQDALVSRMLTQVNELIGYEGRQLVETKLAAWDAPFVMTGVRVGEKTIWRFTPELELGEGVSAQQTLVSGDPATFKVGNRTVRFPRGRVIEFEDQVSTLGFWVETPAKVRPLIR